MFWMKSIVHDCVHIHFSCVGCIVFYFFMCVCVIHIGLICTATSVAYKRK